MLCLKTRIGQNCINKYQYAVYDRIFGDFRPCLFLLPVMLFGNCWAQCFTHELQFLLCSTSDKYVNMLFYHSFFYFLGNKSPANSISWCKRKRTTWPVCTCANTGTHAPWGCIWNIVCYARYPRATPRLIMCWWRERMHCGLGRWNGWCASLWHSRSACGLVDLKWGMLWQG